MSSNPASELGKRRWKGSTKKQRTDFASQGGQARAASLTPEERKAIAVKAAKAATKARKAAAKKKAAEKSSVRKAKTGK